MICNNRVRTISLHKVYVLILIITGCFSFVSAQSLQDSFTYPDSQTGPRCWWWWLNGNVTKEAITKDLQAMADKGFSGAMLFDAGGANQWGNNQVPAGPTFAGKDWTELYLHALNEADRLGLKMGLSIQSGWNLGGPNVTPEYAAKQLTWSEISVVGPTKYSQKLTAPFSRDNFYRDICVLAFPKKDYSAGFKLLSSSSQKEYPPQLAIDQDTETFWVSSGTEPGQGPSSLRPQWIEFTFKEKIVLSGLIIKGRPGYGPKRCRIDCLDKKIKTQSYQLSQNANKITFAPIKGTTFRIVFEDAFDTRYPASPRNVQVADIQLDIDENGKKLLSIAERKPIRDLRLKSGFDEIGMSAPDTRFLLNDYPSTPAEQDADIKDIINLSAKLDADCTLNWDVPQGKWTILRFGYTPTDAHVSTSSSDWHGRVIDYLSESAFNRYWDQTVEPLLVKAGPLVGTVLQQLETDSWECGGMNWSPGFASDFKNYCGYDSLVYLPVIAGKIIESRDASNAFLADFRKTLAHCVSENHYRVFAERAAEHGLGIQPESSGPHAGPMDGITNYSHSEITMSEFWVYAPHRSTPPLRFFVKQAASAAHIYGKKYVAAESFTSIGPHWNDTLWKSQKPSMDHEFCSGLNMIFFHTFTCSPKEMGFPGQEYFAGTHVNPQVTWWDYSDPFMEYINRMQLLTQKGNFVADVLYYYGDHVPNIFPLKESDPAGVLPGYDYDVTNEDVLLQLEVVDGKITTPSGMQYRILVLPDHKVLSLAVLEKVASLLEQGASVLGPKPQRLVSLVGAEAAQTRFHELSNTLWGANPIASGTKQIGKGHLYWGSFARQVLLKDGVNPDFELLPDQNTAGFDYIHYTLDDADVYFVCNQTEKLVSVNCVFRITGKQPELWSPLTGMITKANAFKQTSNQTIIPLIFDPYGSMFVIFDKQISPSINGPAVSNATIYKKVCKIDGPWQVSFDPDWGGPKSVQFNSLTDWAKNSDQGIKYYSGKAAYENNFILSDYNKNKRHWIELNNVEDIGIAAVRLNGRDIGTTWTKPFRLEITDALQLGSNNLEIIAINSWRNRLIGDKGKPKQQRYTNTNISVRNDWNLTKSGLLGPVIITTE